MKIEYRGTQVPIKIRGIIIMTENKEKLIKLILENDNLEQAVLTANAIIIDFLKQLEAAEEETAVCLSVCNRNCSSS